jgi:hypothetical protein
MWRRCTLIWVLKLHWKRLPKTLRICKLVDVALNDTFVSFIRSLSKILMHQFGNFFLLLIKLMNLIKECMALLGHLAVMSLLVLNDDSDVLLLTWNAVTFTCDWHAQIWMLSSVGFLSKRLQTCRGRIHRLAHGSRLDRWGVTLFSLLAFKLVFGYNRLEGLNWLYWRTNTESSLLTVEL